MFFPLNFSSSFLHLFQSIDVRRNGTTAKFTTIGKFMANQHVFEINEIKLFLSIRKKDDPFSTTPLGLPKNYLTVHIMKSATLVLGVFFGHVYKFDECVRAGENMSTLIGSLTQSPLSTPINLNILCFCRLPRCQLFFCNTIVDLFLIPHRVRVFLTRKKVVEYTIFWT